MSPFLVLLFGAFIVTAGLFTVTRRNPIHAALSMLVALGGVATLMLGLRAYFLATMQILLYAGAIMVLVMFVIMLLTLKEEELGGEPPRRQKILAALGSIVLLFVLAGSLSGRKDVQYGVPYEDAMIAAAEAAGQAVPRKGRVEYGSTEYFARFLYTHYVVPFELITVLVMVAAAGVIVLARKPDRTSVDATRLTGGPDA